ncbi:maleylpyruvate isomerase family mycothiol-dependent enzyme [Mycolicibacterium stellerae]|uniref:maleylpyruvate isomerase family mycothiol-dependent enzyme n=1 Tax=Mycolicibacterium stellerae TaxID=2358193 RepID=UPI000F0B406A|nr:maleylpyruvate isomerase family mycothiol-dependent enzyme [Mycolicibacterium stellerae]
MDRIAIIDAEAQRFSDVLASSDPAARCPTCPDWTAGDLLWHLTEVHYFWAGVLGQRVLSGAELPAVEQAKPERPSAMADLVALRASATAALLHELAQREDAEPCWSWWPPDQTVGFTRRMQTYEATMHRVDAELTAGAPVGAIADDVASGALDHAVDVMWGWMPGGATYRVDSVIELVANGTEARWLVEIGSWTASNGETAPRAARATAGEPTAVVTGSVEDLALWAWTRGGTVGIAGDPASLAALDALIAQGMP